MCLSSRDLSIYLDKVENKKWKQLWSRVPSGLPTYNMRTCRPPRKEVAQEARTKMQAVFPLCTAFAPQPLLTRSTLTAPRLAVRAAVAESEEVDFVVVGSGIGGLSCAGLLAASGYTVAALPRFQPPSTSTITSC